MKRSQPKRLWDDARAKVEAEGCRCCFRPAVETAHIIGRHCDQPKTEGSKTLYVHPDSVVGLCVAHHRAYDARELDLLGHLTPEEEARAVLDAGGLELARRRLAPGAYRDMRGAA
jgi:hypothetical protein